MIRTASSIARLGLRCRPTSIRPFSDNADGPKQRVVKVKREKKKGATDTESQRSQELKLIFAALDAPMKQEPPISEEEKARRHQIGRNYTIGCFNRMNEFNHDLACKIKMKAHAINMLPRNSKLKEEALKENTEMSPGWRRIPTWTPPITGFDISQYMDESKE